jgi:predicted kinase
MIKLIVLSGLPGAGKSTAARRLSHLYGARVVARDDLRKFFDGASEHELTFRFVQLAESFLRDGISVIADACNLSSWDFDLWTELSLTTHAVIEWVHLDVAPAECVRRDAQRPNPVGPMAIYEMARLSDG